MQIKQDSPFLLNYKGKKKIELVMKHDMFDVKKKGKLLELTLGLLRV